MGGPPVIKKQLPAGRLLGCFQSFVIVNSGVKKLLQTSLKIRTTVGVAFPFTTQYSRAEQNFLESYLPSCVSCSMMFYIPFCAVSMFRISGRNSLHLFHSPCGGSCPAVCKYTAHSSFFTVLTYVRQDVRTEQRLFTFNICVDTAKPPSLEIVQICSFTKTYECACFPSPHQ